MKSVDSCPKSEIKLKLQRLLWAQALVLPDGVSLSFSSLIAVFSQKTKQWASPPWRVAGVTNPVPKSDDLRAAREDRIQPGPIHSNRIQVPAAAALRLAHLVMRKPKRRQFPHYRVSVILQGDWI